MTLAVGMILRKILNRKRTEGENMKLTMLGTGNALVTECYNACFALTEGKDSFPYRYRRRQRHFKPAEKNADIALEKCKRYFYYS